MIVPLEEGDIKDFVKLLLRCYEMEFTKIFGDVYLAYDVLLDYYSNLEDRRGIFVSKARERAVGLVEIWVREIKRGKLPFSDFIKTFGFLEGLKARLLLSFFDKRPKRDEAYVRHICLHPDVRLEFGERLVEKAIEFARELGKREISVWLPVESDFVDMCMNRGFEIRRMLDSKYAERYFGRRYYYLLVKSLD